MKKSFKECEKIIMEVGDKFYKKNTPYEVCLCSHTEEEYQFKIDRGGMSGGNCWGNEPSSYTGYVGSYNTDEIIYDVLSEIDETMPFLVVKKIINECKTTETDEQYEYYGNYTNYEIITYDCRKMLNILAEKGIIEYNP